MSVEFHCDRNKIEVNLATLNFEDIARFKTVVSCQIERSMMRAMCAVQLRERERVNNLMLVLAMSETIDQLATTNSVRCYGHVMRMEDGHILRYGH